MTYSATTLVGGWLVLVAWLFFAGFFALLAEGFSGAGRMGARLVTVGASLAAAVGFAGALPLAAAGVLAADGELSPEIAKALVLMNAATFVIAWLPAALAVGASAALSLRTGALPRWVGRFGVLLAPVLAAGSLLVWRYEAAFLAWLAAMVWIAAASVSAARRGLDRTAASAVTASPQPARATAERV